MTIAVGDHLPQVEFLSMTGDGPQKLSTDVVFAGRKVVLFAVPGAFTPTCSRNHLPGFLTDCAKLLAPGHAAMVLTVYAIRASALAFDQLVRDTLNGKGGAYDRGELAIRATSGPAVPTSLFVRWSNMP